MTIYKDTAEFYSLDFPDVASPISENLVFFHDQVMSIIIFILIIVAWMMISTLINKKFFRNLTEGILIEFIWTLTPAIILIFIAFPSLQILYSMDDIIDPSLTIKAIGHQWYWSYEYSDSNESTVEFDSYMLPSSDLKKGDFRLLEVDNKLVLPLNTPIRVIVSGADVIHSFAIPSLGVKADAIPGRLNQVNFYIKRPGIYFGQCSEICGSEHSFMPIVVNAVSSEKFFNWFINQSE
nr:cytochrome c oxidase subunit II [Nemalecium lighti]